MTPEETIPLLNNLIRTCKDGEAGYRAAEAGVKNTELQTVFAGYAKQRAEFARHLQAEVERLGGTPEDEGTVTGTLYRGWMNLKSTLSGGDDVAIIASCETGEDSAAAAFERVAYMNISGKTKSLVDSQWEKIKEAHSRMERLNEETAAHFQKND